ncbi:MAG: serine/threonine protein kinase [Solirubrobacterales bacterium]
MARTLRAGTIDQQELQEALPPNVALGSKIHDGGQRKVYRAKREGVDVVLKVMPIDAVERAEREVSIGCTFDHPNLARILDDELSQLTVGEDDFVWFCEEYIDGEVLASRVGVYEPCEALDLASDLIEAVAYLWERHDVVHRDIKPLNIIRRSSGGYVLIDVGIGRHQGDPSITSGALGPGTIGYLAAEQYIPNKGRMLDSRTDLFLIGIVVFQVLTDVLPFRPNDPDYYAKLLSGDWPRPQGLPAPISELLERFLGRNPHQRPPIAQAAGMILGAKEELGCS